MNSIVRGKENWYLKICDISAGDLLESDDTFRVYGVSDPLDPISNTIIFVKKSYANDSDVKNCIIISKDSIIVDNSCINIVSEKPKNEYAKLLSKIEITEDFDGKEINGSYIGNNAQIGTNVSIGKFCIVSNDVVIGDNCKIADYVYIGPHTRIGNNVCIKERVTIGISDADIYRERGKCLTLQHLGGTIIEDGCLILAGAHVAAGDTRATVIRKGSMIGINTTIGHNTYVGINTLVGAHVCVCGHCDIGDEAYIAPSSVIMNRLSVGKKAKVGLGAVVLDDVEAHVSVFGNPAMMIWKKNERGL